MKITAKIFEDEACLHYASSEIARGFSYRLIEVGEDFGEGTVEVDIDPNIVPMWHKFYVKDVCLTASVPYGGWEVKDAK